MNEQIKNPSQPPKNEGVVQEISLNPKPKGMTEEEAQQLLEQNIDAEFSSLVLELEKHHAIFSQIWDMGIPRLSWDIDTACVTFDKEGRNVEFLFNPIFWRDTDNYTKAFVISHEALHVMLSHGLRIQNCPLPRLANKALDVVVNHMLVSKFGFHRKSINIGIYPEGHEKAGEKIELCWIDTVFPNMVDLIDRDRTFEYYYHQLEKHAKILPNGKVKIKAPALKGASGQGSGRGQNDGKGQGDEGGEASGQGDGNGEGAGWAEVSGEELSNHETLKEFDDKAKNQIGDHIDDNLDDDAKKDLWDKLGRSQETRAAEKAEEANGGGNGESAEDSSDSNGDGSNPGGHQAGSLAGRFTYKANIKKVKPKKKWESVIKKWSRKYKSKDANEEQWLRKARRYSNIGGNLMLPFDAEMEARSETRITVRFYQDTSGSCAKFRDRFFHAAKSLPKDRFNVELYCFDTQIYETSLEEGKLYGFGGTYFDILEEHIQRQLKSGDIKKYPEAVFVITDGMGNKVFPEQPEKWYWFLSDKYTHCIPEECHKFMLRDYE